MGHGEVFDKHGNAIHEGDYVVTKIRGGTHEGKVSQERHHPVDPTVALSSLVMGHVLTVFRPTLRWKKS
jgi:hypothetical protein